MLDRLTKINIYVLSRPAAIAIGFAIFTLVVATDYLTPYELNLTPFYLFVILLVTWNCGWRWGLAFSIISCVVTLVMGNLYGRSLSASGSEFSRKCLRRRTK